ncbi:hypothetical protein BDR26DRAFT_877357 [Obelidium mucronatum]|nr:hypothetical protein BDR26DRAFT_877357 [Obelidium mucronatum]
MNVHDLLNDCYNDQVDGSSSSGAMDIDTYLYIDSSSQQDQFTTLPPELIAAIIATLPCRNAFKLRRLSRRINNILLTPHFSSQLLSYHWDYAFKSPPPLLLLNGECFDEFDAYFFKGHESYQIIYSNWFKFGLQQLSFFYYENTSSPILRLTNCTLPYSLSAFTNLRTFQLFNHGIVGQIPSFLGTQLTNLVTLNLRQNNLTGRIPVSLENCVRLTSLDLSFNFLDGDIPAQLFTRLTSLIYLNLSNNQLDGVIPQDGIRMHHLQDLSLDSNRLTGVIPEALASGCPSLASLDVSKNDLWGGIPASFVNGLPELEHLSVALGNPRFMVLEGSPVVDALRGRGVFVK